MTVRTKIRQVVDARRDFEGVEDPSNSNLIGWTTHYITSFSNSTTAWQNYANYFMSGLIQPTQDGVIVNNANQTATLDPNPPAEVGLKHYQHQMQAMKSTSFPIEMGGDNNTNSSSSLGVIGTDGYVSFSGGFGSTLKQFNIKMGEMRGFEYSRNSDSTWPSSTSNGDGLENLQDTLEIGIGPVSTGGGGGGGGA